jgi:hypothetical protein
MFWPIECTFAKTDFLCYIVLQLLTVNDVSTMLKKPAAKRKRGDSAHEIARGFNDLDRALGNITEEFRARMDELHGLMGAIYDRLDTLK